MVKRLLLGLVLGSVIGAAVAALLVQGLGLVTFGAAVVAYLAAAATGVIVGLVAGKPIWSSDGKIEAGLKAFFGALLAMGAMFVLKRWVSVDVDLVGLSAGAGPVGELPAAALPIIAALLGGFYELDNTPSAAGDKGGKEEGAAKADAKVRVGAKEDDADEGAEEESDEPAANAARRRR